MSLYFTQPPEYDFIKTNRKKRMNRNQVAKGTEVKYQGLNRKWLSNYPKAVLDGQYSSNTNGAFVEFFDETGRRVDTAWVGLSYLEVVSHKHQATITALNEKRDALLTEAAGIDTAIAALKALG